MKTLILLGGGIEAVPIIQRVRELGFRAVVVDGNPNAPGRAVADAFIDSSCYHGNQVIAALQERMAQLPDSPPDGVLCAAVDAPIACAEVAAAFGLPGLSVEAARLSQDKYMQKNVLYEAGVFVPAFRQPGQCWSDNKPINNYRPTVIKPIDSRGGRGVIRILPDVDPTWAYEQARAASPTRRIMVEQWLDGPQLSTESIVQGGRVMFTAVGLRNYARLDEFAPYVIEDGFDEPYPDHAFYEAGAHNIDHEIKSIIESACHALGWYQAGAGTVKGDLVIHDGKVYVIELAARLSGGFFASHGHPLAYGVDFVGAAIKAALGYTLDEPNPYAREFVCQRYVFPSPEDVGKTVSVMASPEYRYMPHSERFFSSYNIRTGDVVKPVTSHPARWGQALAMSRTPDEARQIAEAAVVAMKAGVVLA